MSFQHNNIEYDVHMKLLVNDLNFNDENKLSSFTILFDINLTTTNNPDYVVILNKDVAAGITSAPKISHRFNMMCNGKVFNNDIVTKKCVLDNYDSMVVIKNIKYYSNGKNGKKYL